MRTAIVEHGGCDACEMLRINGVPCHETGCPKTPVGKCDACGESLIRGEVYQANDWDGMTYCHDCADAAVEFEAQQEADFADAIG